MTNALFSLFKTDADIEVSGKWVYPAGEPTEDNPNPPAFKIARAGGANKKYMNAQAALLKPHRALLRTNDISPEKLAVMDSVAKKCFFETILLDWKDVPNSKGEIIPFSRANAEDMMKQLPALYEFLMGEAQSIGTFSGADTEEDAGN